MIAELTAASQVLHSALERYLDACTVIQRSCSQGDWQRLNDTYQELSNRVFNDLLLLVSYESKLRIARAAIDRARNCHSPINTLPDELLARVFRLFADSQSCTTKESGGEPEDILFPQYPDLLSHVCSRWRQVSISSRALWSHIDLAPCNRLHQGLLDRAEVHANRAGHLPLYIHVTCLRYPLGWTQTQHLHKRFLDSVSTRIQSLELFASDTTAANAEDLYIDANILDGFLGECKPGVLTELTLTSNTIPAFLKPSGMDLGNLDCANLKSSYEFFENLWHSITVLRLRGLHPYWTSKAYHGLVELRLTIVPDDGHDVSISESQLVTILTSSPRLRILHLSLETTDYLPENASITPVHLGDLQIASFTVEDSIQAGRLLRWLAPGSSPLQLSIAMREQFEQFVSNDNINAFFERSVTTRLRLLGVPIPYQEVVNLLHRLPKLRVLVLENSNCVLDSKQAISPESSPEVHSGPTMPPRVEHLYLLRCRSDPDDVQWVIEQRLSQMLTLWDCTLTPNQETQAQVDTPQIFNTHSGVEFIDGDKPNPCGDWD